MYQGLTIDVVLISKRASRMSLSGIYIQQIVKGEFRDLQQAFTYNTLEIYLIV